MFKSNIDIIFYFCSMEWDLQGMEDDIKVAAGQCHSMVSYTLSIYNIHRISYLLYFKIGCFLLIILYGASSVKDVFMNKCS